MENTFVLRTSPVGKVRLIRNLLFLAFALCLTTIVVPAQSIRKVEILSSPLGNASSGEVVVVNSTGLVYTAGQAFGGNYGVIDPNSNSLIKVIRPANLDNFNAVSFSRVNQTTNLVYFLRGSTQIDVVDGRTTSATFNQLLPSLAFSNQTIIAYAVDSTRNRIYVSTRVTGSSPIQSNVLTIDANPASATFHQVLTTTALPAGQQVGHIAVNVTTNKVYIASQLSTGGVFVLNNAAQTLTKIASTIAASSIVINETSNTVYAGLNGTVSGGASQIQAIDGNNDTLTINISVPGAFLGNFGEFGAVNSITERVYLVLSNSSLCVIDAKRTSPTFNSVVANVPNVGFGGEIAVSEQLNKIVIADRNSFNTIIINGATNTVAAVVKGNMAAEDVAINPATQRAYVGYVFFTTQSINLNDNSFTNIGTAAEISEGIVNPNNNSFYLGRTSRIADLIFFNQNDSLGSITGEPHDFGRYVFAAQNKTTNRLYFPNSSANLTATASVPGFVAVVDGATNNVVANVEVGGQPFSNPAVNETTNKIYQMNAGLGTNFPSKISVINGANNTASDVNTSAFAANSSFIREPAVNPTTNKIYFRVGEGTSVGVINGVTDVATPLAGYTNVFDIKVNPSLNRIYILTSTALRVLNGANDAEIANIAFSSPSLLRINQTTGKIYVLQSPSTQTLSVIDPNSNTITATVPLENGVTMTINETTNELYVAKVNDFSSEDSSSILFINGDTLAIRNTLSLPLRAGRLAINPATKTLYVITVNALQRTGVVIVSLDTRRAQFDFDGDGRSDQSVFRSGFWYLLRSQAGFTGLQFGAATDKIVPADYDGDGKTDIAVFRDGFWYWLNSSNNAFSGVQFGQAGDIPAPADYTGDGRADLAVFRLGNWYILNLANNQFQGVQFGVATDKPVAADYDGDGKADIAVVRQTGGASNWYILGTTRGFYGLPFGADTDKLVPADYDGDGKTDVAVYRSGNWYIQGSTQGFYGVLFGNSTDIPVPADYDGDGKSDVAVFRDGTWYALRSQQGLIGVQFGAAGDRPIPAAFIP